MRVLVCDDDATVGTFIATMFGFEGWDTAVVTSGELCLATLAEGPEPDVLVLDQVMPGLQGTEVAEQLRAQGFRRPIILCSAHLGVEQRDDIARLDLLPINKIDIQAVLRLAQNAVQEDQKPTDAAPAG